MVVCAAMTPRRPSRVTSFSFVRRYRLRPYAAETTWSPRFLGNPGVRLPCSSTPVGPSRLALKDEQSVGSCCCRRLSPLAGASILTLFAVSTPRGALVPSPCLDRQRTPGDISVFGAQSHSLRTRCLRFAAFLSLAELYGYARLASGWGPTCPGRDWLPAGLLREVSASSLHGFLLTQACPGAHPTLS
jgi:hypothetical protein